MALRHANIERADGPLDLMLRKKTPSLIGCPHMYSSDELMSDLVSHVVVNARGGPQIQGDQFAAIASAI